VNRNQVFKWRKQYQQGKLEVGAPNTLLPVRISDAVPVVAPPAGRKSRTRKTGIIDIDMGHARVRIEGAADPDCVRATLEGLIR
jgi:transposase